jgi:peroxiredoxin
MKFKIFLLLALAAISTLAVAAQNAKSRTEPLAAGAFAPDFSLTERDGRTITLSKAETPVVLVFYRGYWCPFCARQLAELRGLLKPREAAALYAVSVDAPEKSRDLAGKIAKDGKGAIAFSLLSDPNHRTIDAYGVFDPSYLGQETEGIPRPAIFIIDKNRKIVWAKIETDYRKRPAVEEIRAELDKLR